MWRWWSYALGRKEGRDKKDADNIALIRTILILMTMTTNGFIIAGVVRHWNDCPNSSAVAAFRLHRKCRGFESLFGHCLRSSVVEQGFCKAQVAGSNPVRGFPK
jgi:hypothetical protein